MSEKVKACESCEEQPATVLCSECCRCYCDECNEHIHKEVPMKDHKAEAIPESVIVDALCPLHRGEPLSMFCVDDVDLCCPMCRAEGFHKGHNVVNLSEIPQDSKVFSVSEVRARFVGALERDDELDKKIEETMESIRDKWSDVRAKISQAFMEAHKRLEEEEAKIMGELESVCNENEEALQKDLEELREVCEYSKILNEFDTVMREKEPSRLMELNLASSMEKQRRTMEELQERMMRDIDFWWDNEGRKLTCTKTLFNGAPIPNGIFCRYILDKETEVSWECDLSDLSEEDKRKLKYVLEMKEPYEKEWKEVYVGEDNQRHIVGLEEDTEYELSVRCVVGELQGGRSDVMRIRTKRVPKIESISFPKISLFEIEVSWECNDSYLSKEELAELKYSLMAKKAGVGEWEEIFFGKQKNHLAADLEEGAEYDFAVRCVIGDLRGEQKSAAGVRTRMMPIPTNISFPRVSRKEVEVTWDCDPSRMYEDDREQLEYVISMNKAGEKEWKDVYVGRERKHVITGLEDGTRYFLCVGCNAGNLQGEWSATVNVMTECFNPAKDSLILEKEFNREGFLEKLAEWCGTKSFCLLYRGSRDGFAASDFHRMCDNKGKTLVLVKDVNGYVSGGFASVPWTSSDRVSRAPGSFIFTLRNAHGVGATKFSLKRSNDGKAVQHYAKYGPLFGAGCDFGIGSNCNEKSSSMSNFPNSYDDTTGHGKGIFTGKKIGKSFQVQEIEVFSVNI